jgi:hypothetical protein
LSNPVIDGHDVRSPTPSFPGDFAAIGTTQKIIADPAGLTNRPGDREAAEGALERNLLANGFISLFTEEASSSTIRFVTHNFQRTAILKFRSWLSVPSRPNEYSAKLTHLQKVGWSKNGRTVSSGYLKSKG